MRHKMLLIENDYDFLSAYCRFFESKGHRVFAVSSFADAYRHVVEHRPDIILLAISLPEGSGFELCGHIRRITLITPIVFLMDISDEVDIMKGLKHHGGNDYIIKSHALEVIQTRIMSLINDVRNASDPCVEFLSLQIYPKSFQVFMNGENIHLEKREYRLLLYLVQNAGVELSIDDIYHTVWKVHKNSKSKPHLVHAYIYRLRRKLKLRECNGIQISMRYEAGYTFLWNPVGCLPITAS